MKSESDVRAAINATVLATIPLIQVPRRSSVALKAAVAAVVATGVLGIVAAGIRYLR
jgi:hypothetical protein